MRVNGQEYSEERRRRLSDALRAVIAACIEAHGSDPLAMTAECHALVDLAYDLNEEMEGFDEVEDEDENEVISPVR